MHCSRCPPQALHRTTCLAAFTPCLIATLISAVLAVGVSLIWLDTEDDFPLGAFIAVLIVVIILPCVGLVRQPFVRARLSTRRCRICFAPAALYKTRGPPVHHHSASMKPLRSLLLVRGRRRAALQPTSLFTPAPPASRPPPLFPSHCPQGCHCYFRWGDWLLPQRSGDRSGHHPQGCIHPA